VLVRVRLLTWLQRRPSPAGHQVGSTRSRPHRWATHAGRSRSSSSPASAGGGGRRRAKPVAQPSNVINTVVGFRPSWSLRYRGWTHSPETRAAMHDARTLTAGVVTTLDEDDALARAATVDPRAFAAIYERHRTSVYRYVRSRTTSDDEVGELCAVTFERALAAIGRFRSSGGGMLAWLLRIARNAHTDTSRRPPQNARREIEPGEAETAESGLGLEDRVILRSLVGGCRPLSATRSSSASSLRMPWAPVRSCLRPGCHRRHRSSRTAVTMPA
jgi:RNA polymerase sigma factor (sigma-70 family)